MSQLIAVIAGGIVIVALLALAFFFGENYGIWKASRRPSAKERRFICPNCGLNHIEAEQSVMERAVARGAGQGGFYPGGGAR